MKKSDTGTKVTEIFNPKQEVGGDQTKFKRFQGDLAFNQSTIAFELQGILYLVRSLKEDEERRTGEVSEETGDLEASVIEVIYQLKLKYSPRGIDPLIRKLEEEVED